jgi:hypothetical protein
MDIQVRLGGVGMGDVERAELARGLRELLSEIDAVDDVARVAGGPVPVGAKSALLVTWGAVLVSVASTGSFEVVVDTIASWLGRQPADIEVEIDGQRLSGSVSREQREALVQAFLARTSDPTAKPDQG